VEIYADRRGLYPATATINGRNLGVIVDTGASYVALTRMDASHLGINPRPSEFTIPMNTPNGITWMARVTLKEVAIGNISVRNVPAVVHADDGMGTTLLGNSFLLRVKVTTSNGRMTLTP
jgi:aspartyl protease family protein